MSRHGRIVSSLLVLGLIGAAGCFDDLGDLTTSSADRQPSAAEPGARRLTETARWNEIARELSQKYRPSQIAGIRSFAYLTLAQYDGLVAAERTPGVAVRGAVAGASVTVLTALYPAEGPSLELLLRTTGSEVLRGMPGGVAVGRQVGAQVVASMATDNFTLAWAGTVPTGPGSWIPSGPPIAPRLGETRPFFLTSGSQFRPGQPPAFGSPAFLEALGEVRRFSDTRTPEQDALAKFWAVPAGYAVIVAYENLLLSELTAKYHLSEGRTAHAFALVHLAAMDALIACHDAKYTFWLLRPTQADPQITLSVPLPNHPSYPSNHACVSGAFMATAAALFPEEAHRLNGLADEATFSRIVGGLHYRFDGAAGLAIGRRVSAWAVAHDVGEDEPFPIR